MHRSCNVEGFFMHFFVPAALCTSLAHQLDNRYHHHECQYEHNMSNIIKMFSSSTRENHKCLNWTESIETMDVHFVL